MNAHQPDHLPAQTKFPVATNIDIDSFSRQFLQQSQNLSEASRTTYKKALRIFFRWLTDHGIHNPREEDLLNFRNDLYPNVESQRQLEPTTVNTYLTALKSFFTWLEANHHYPNVAIRIKNIPVARTFRKDSFSIEEVQSLFEAIFLLEEKELAKYQNYSEKRQRHLQKMAIEKAIRNYAIFSLTFSTGLRLIEISRADIGDLRKKDGRDILLIQGKGKSAKSDFVILNEQVIQPIYHYLEIREDCPSESALFAATSNRNRGGRMTTNAIYKIFHNIFQYCGFDSRSLSPHSARHTAAQLALKSGAPVDKVQEMLRHASIDTTRIYLKGLNRLIEPAEDHLQQTLKNIYKKWS